MHTAAARSGTSFSHQRLPILQHHQRRTLAWGHRRNIEAAAISGNVERDNSMNSGAGFGVDGKKRLGLPGVGSTRIESKWHGIDLSIETQIIEFLAVLAPAHALRSLAGYQKAF